MGDKPYGEMSLEELTDAIRPYAPGASQYEVRRAELDLRVAIEQIKAAKAQVRSAWWQGAMVIAMYLTVLATIAAPWISVQIAR